MGEIWSQMYRGLQEEYHYYYYYQILTKLKFCRNIFEKYSNTNSHENPSSGIGAFPCGETDMTKLINAFRNFTNTSKKS